jgi:hypothetical protein
MYRRRARRLCGGGAPSFVLNADGYDANIDLPLTGAASDLGWWNGQLLPISSILTCSRTGTATYTNAAGVVSDVAANTLRYGSAGLLVEESRINVIRQSQAFSHANWTKTNCTATDNTTVASDGTTTAATITASAGSGLNPTFIDTSITTTNGIAYTASIYAKAGTHSWLQGSVNNQGTDFVNFNLATGIATASGGATATMTLVSQGLYRCTYTYTTAGTDRRCIWQLAASATATRQQTWSPVGTETIIVWGAQLEAGAFATSYIRTAGAAVTRNADNISFVSSTGQLLSRGTWAADWTTGPSPSSGVTQNIVMMRVDANNYSRLIVNGSAAVVAQFRASSSDVALLASPITAAVANTTYKQAAAYDTNDFAQTMTASLDAGQPNTDSSGTPASGSFTTFVGSDNGSAGFNNGHIRRLTHWTDRRISNTGLAALVV